MKFFSWIKQKFSVCKAVAFVTYKEWAAYRTHSMVSIFVGPVYFIVQFFIWKAVYGNPSVGSDGIIAGMSFESIVRYFAVSTLIGYLTMDFADWNLQMLIRTGKFLTFAIRPIHHRFFALSQKFGHRVLGFIFEFLPCLLILQFIFNINVLPTNYLQAIISVILAFFMIFYVNYCLGMTAFFLVKADGISYVYVLFAQIFSGALIPINFFPEIIQKIMMFLPFQYASYVPTMIWIGNSNIGGFNFSTNQTILLQALVVLFMAIFSEIMYKASIKRFTAVGA